LKRKTRVQRKSSGILPGIILYRVRPTDLMTSYGHHERKRRKKKAQKGIVARFNSAPTRFLPAPEEKLEL